MSIFLTLMILGLAGLLLMAIPGIGRHGSHGLGHGGHGGGGPLSGHGGHLHLGHGAGHAAALPSSHGGGIGTGHGLHGGSVTPSHGIQGGAAAPLQGSHPVVHTSGGHGVTHGAEEMGTHAGDMGGARLIPSPRAIFSVVALFGAFGYALAGTVHLPILFAALAAIIPALLVERLALTPLWNLLFQFEGKPSASLSELLLEDVEAVTPFRNGRGIVKALHDGRVVQLSAHLTPSQSALPVRVGDKLRVEDVDAIKERVTVSLK